MSIRLFICCDDLLSCAGVRTTLAKTADFLVVGESVNNHTCVRDATSERADIIIVKGRAFDAAVHRELAEIAKVVTFVHADSMPEPADIMSLHARAVLSSDILPEELVPVIRIVAAGNALLLPATISAHVEKMIRDDDMFQLRSASFGLTDRETQVLKLLAKGMSNADIALSLFVSAATVRCHVHRILGKLCVRSRGQAVAAAYECGLLGVMTRCRVTSCRGS